MKARTHPHHKWNDSFSVAKMDRWQVFSREEWKIENLQEILNRHGDSFSGGKECVVKEGRRTVVTLFEFAGRTVCVKEYRSKGIGLKLKELLRGSKARKAWVKGNEIFKRGITAINPVALVEKRRWGYLKEAFLIMESHPGFVDLRSYARDGFGDPQRGRTRKRVFMRQLAAFLAGLYNLKIAHRDLKITNILVKEIDHRWSFALTDWEDLELDKQITSNRLVKGLVQMNTSDPLFFSVRDRLWFLREYFTLIGRDDVKRVSREVIRRSEKRGWAAPI